MLTVKLFEFALKLEGNNILDGTSEVISEVAVVEGLEIFLVQIDCWIRL